MLLAASIAIVIGVVINAAFPGNNVSIDVGIILWFIFSFLIISRVCRKNGHSIWSDIKPVRFQPIGELALPIIMPQLLNFGIILFLAALIPSEVGLTDPSIPSAAANPTMDFLVTVVFTPFFEEIIFRWFLFRKLAAKVSIWKAIVISSILFGIMHGVVNFVPTAIAGAIFCILFEKYKSLFPCIVVHFINNITAFMLMFYSNQAGDTSTTPMPDDGYLLTFSAILIITSIILMIFFFKKRKLGTLSKQVGE
jgi:membrane protease YdiL (CAAX protease family)